jgi:uncharacterized protein (TIGR03032 family)
VNNQAKILDGLWAHHHAVLRDPHQIVAQWRQASDIDPALLEAEVRGAWWDTLERKGLTLLITREYEHLVLACCVHDGRPRVSYLHLPHPNGLAVDADKGRVYIASTRNPNMVFDFAASTGERAGRTGDPAAAGLLLPTRSRYLPGCLYTHDLALIGGKLYANAVGLNAVVRLPEVGGFELAWWPKCIDTAAEPRTDKNYLQLNSIAASSSLRTSFFTASTAAPSRRRPGHRNFVVDRRGVVFSGATREVVGTGLTRPHSARLFRREVWVDNSGYGEVGRIVEGRFEPVMRLPGWTRGLFFAGDIAFVGTSRVIPQYAHYAPGLDPARCCTGVHALDLKTGAVIGSLLWPAGNQIFAIEGVRREFSIGFPFTRQNDRNRRRHVELFSRGLVA